MDKQLIAQYGEDILSYRLRTARQKKRMQYEDFDKQLLKIHREQRALRKRKVNLGWEPLVPPVQKGWKRSFVLREDVAKSRQADFFEQILKKINSYDWSYRKDFKINRRKAGRKIYVVKAQRLLRPYSWEFNRLFDIAQQQMFHEVQEIDKKGTVSIRYEFNEPWRFVLRVQPNIIDKVRKRDAALEARIRRIYDFLERNNLSPRLERMLGIGRRWWSNKGKEFYDDDIFKNKSLNQIMDIIRET